MPTNRYRSQADYIKHKSCDQELSWRSKNPAPCNGYTSTSYSVYNNRCYLGQGDRACKCIVHSTISSKNSLVDCVNTVNTNPTVKC